MPRPSAFVVMLLLGLASQAACGRVNPSPAASPANSGNGGDDDCDKLPSPSSSPVPSPANITDAAVTVLLMHSAANCGEDTAMYQDLVNTLAFGKLASAALCVSVPGPTSHFEFHMHADKAMKMVSGVVAQGTAVGAWATSSGFCGTVLISSYFENTDPENPDAITILSCSAKKMGGFYPVAVPELCC